MISDFRANKVSDQPRRLQMNDIMGIKASSYIWQPWFALVGGGLGLVNSREFRGESDDQTRGQPRNLNARSVTGNGEATLFPVSRFPFTAYFDVSDSRASGEPGTGEFSSTRFGARQSYRPPEGNANYAASFNHSTLESPLYGTDTVNAFSASANRNVGAQTFDLAGTHTGNTRSNTGEHTAFTNLITRHAYRPDPQFSVNSLGSLSASDYRLNSSGVPTANRSRFAQANTFASWRPDEDSPWFFTGGGRMFRSSIASNAGSTESSTLSGNLAATYALSRQTRISAGATVTQLFSDVAGTLLTTQTAGVSHVGDPFRFYDFTYAWNAGANAANQSGLPEGMRQNVNSQLGHNVNRNLTLGEHSQLNFGLGQNLGAGYDSLIGDSRALGHNGSVSWRLTRDAATTAYASLLGSDTRTTGAYANHFQLVNLQATGQVQFSRSSMAAANLTVQGIRQTTRTNPDAPANINSSGNLTYTHMRAFNVPRLRYYAIYTVNDTQFKTRLQGDFNAPRERISQSFEQRLDYSVGRVGIRLTMRVAEIEGRRDALIFLRVAREFGNF